jgi:hypothetical protein
MFAEWWLIAAESKNPTAEEAKFLKKVIAHKRAVAIIRVRFRKNREWNFINH